VRAVVDTVDLHAVVVLVGHVQQLIVGRNDAASGIVKLATVQMIS
jgi:hypothetical protein